VDQSEIITQCLGCYSIRLDDDSWESRGELYRAGNVSHGYCGPCANIERAKLEEWKKQRTKITKKRSD